MTMELVIIIIIVNIFDNLDLKLRLEYKFPIHIIINIIGPNQVLAGI